MKADVLSSNWGHDLYDDDHGLCFQYDSFVGLLIGLLIDDNNGDDDNDNNSGNMLIIIIMIMVMMMLMIIIIMLRRILMMMMLMITIIIMLRRILMKIVVIIVIMMLGDVKLHGFIIGNYPNLWERIETDTSFNAPSPSASFPSP